MHCLPIKDRHGFQPNCTFLFKKDYPSSNPHFHFQIGHAERHENMQMTLLSEAEADAILTQPLELGLCRSLLQKVPEKNQKDVIALSDTLGCRHCLQAIDITTKAPAGQNHTQPHPPRKEKLRNLNALRSHLKALYVYLAVHRACESYAHVLLIGTVYTSLAMRTSSALCFEGFCILGHPSVFGTYRQLIQFNTFASLPMIVSASGCDVVLDTISSFCSLRV